MKNKKNEDAAASAATAGGASLRRPVRFLLDRIIYPTSLYFTVATLALYIGGMAFGSEGRTMIPTLRVELLVLFLCLVFNAANLILRAGKLHLALRIALHFCITAISLFLLFINVSDEKPGGSLTIILLLAYSVIYAVVCAVVFRVRASAKKAKNDKSEYKPIYDKL